MSVSRLVQRLRRKKEDTKIKEVPSSKRGKRVNKREKKPTTISDKQFEKLLEVFVTNKEAIKNFTDANKQYYPDLVSYVREHGAKDAKGNRMTRVGQLVANVLISVPRILNVDKVAKFVNKLRKRNHITKKEEKEIIQAHYTIRMTEDQYKRISNHIDDMGIIPDREVIVNEEKLQLLIHKGVASVEEITNLYDEQAESVRFTPTRLKE